MTPAPGTAGTEVGRRAARAVFAVFVLNGFLFATWVSRLPAVRDALGLDPAQLGLLLLVGSVGSLLALPLTGAVVQRLGTARTVLAAAGVAVAGFAVVALGVQAGSVPLLGAGLFVAQAGIGAWDVAMNLEGGAVEHAVGRAIMPRFHAGFSVGTVAGAGVGALAALAGVPVPVHLVGGLVVALATVAVSVRAFLPAVPVPSAPGRRGGLAAALSGWREGRTVLIGLLVLAAALTEGAANDWLALAVVDGFHTRDAMGALAFGVFVAAMTLMRFAGELLLGRFGRVAVLRMCTGLALVGLVVFVASPWLPLALVGAAVWGLGAALGFPVGMSAASDDPLRAAARVSVVSSIGYTAFLVGPPLLGLLADVVGYRPALLAIAVPLVLSLLLAPVARPPARPGHDDAGAPASTRPSA
ncbi:MFS transporter [Georgenia faecalis]|uniref:MFS transporter n=1 Tax=Georgenia faecalis TaxID=2483799 RepID=A0ABV9D7V6_9MICO|nr:MFS transporter [Georgenia faecalis]